ncbi:MAG: DNA-directed RNA polymerase subunit beta' [Chloroflexi bacterium]|nr:DNA-directed RNA polymerase subunit beta' [Chloroflexota bacterium]
MLEVNDFNAVRISLASPEQIRSWSYGEVTKPETINYRTLKPEKDGLFCEKIFGPTKDFECYCGKYKRVRYKGIVCDKCGVEVARSKVRRERMGHIELASPVSHIWFVKGTPSRMGLLLDISPRMLERVLYFAGFIVTSVDEHAKKRAQEHLQEEMEREAGRREKQDADGVVELQDQLASAEKDAASERERKLAQLEEERETQADAIMQQAVEYQDELSELVGKSARKGYRLGDTLIVERGTVIEESVVKGLKKVAQERIAALEADTKKKRDDIALLSDAALDQKRNDILKELKPLEERAAKVRDTVEAEYQERIKELEELVDPAENDRMTLLTEPRFKELQDRYGNVFEAGMGAEAILRILERVNVEKLREKLQTEIHATSGQRRKKATKRLKVVESLRKSGNHPSWMVFTVLPVMPPELRPMVQLDGGRFATSDLNDLYRRVINRNNRLKRLLELGAPEIIIRNEKRMLQEAVDSLIDNGRRGRAVAGSGNHKLKSLSDMLKGKQGRFRQNLLGKRVDYSGRSVIVVGPELKLHQCGLPKRMALELFKPFVMHALVSRGIAHNIKSAKRIVERARPEVWDVLDEVIHTRPVLLNRAPTLHRLGIQAFEPVLIEGSAIQIHPLVCTAFNADFDGDQMAVHVPLSREAVAEARQIMLSTHNLLSPGSGEPIIAPTLDMVLGCYYLTDKDERGKGAYKKGTNGHPTVGLYGSEQEARLSHDLGIVDLRAPIKVRVPYAKPAQKRHREPVPALPQGAGYAMGLDDDQTRDGDGVTPAVNTTEIVESFEMTQPGVRPQSEIIDTTVGRLIFNEILPAGVGSTISGGIDFVNRTMDRKELKDVVARCYELLGNEETAEVVDAIKHVGFEYATYSGVSIAVNDLRVPAEKPQMIESTEAHIREIDDEYEMGLITEQERYEATVEAWKATVEDVKRTIQEQLKDYGSVYTMANSGAKGNISQITQMAGMRGLMTDPSGRIIDLPIRSSFREGLTVLEYFISTHGARKGLADTALRTADSGYLTRRLIDVAQDVIILEEDCGTRTGVWLDQPESGVMESFAERITGRYSAMDLEDPEPSEPGELLAAFNEEIDDTRAARIEALGITRVYVRSALTCAAKRGICRYCYGRSPARGALVTMGEAVGIVAAQSIGEPGTQLTMRTFHTGGVASSLDITSGLPRVEELFEARVPKGQALISEIDGTVEVVREGDTRRARIKSVELYSDEYDLPKGVKLLVKKDEIVEQGTILARLPELASGQPKAAEEEAPAKKTRSRSKKAKAEEMPAVREGDVVARLGGRVVLTGKDRLSIVYEEHEEREYAIPAAARLRVENNDAVQAGQQITDGSLNPQDILRISGPEAVQLYLVGEVQKVYRSQGVTINDKHIEVIVRQMLRKVRVDAPGDTGMLPNDIVDRFEYEAINERVLAEGGEPATAVPVLLGVTKASLSTSSFLAAASFQETTRVLTEAAISGQTDHLMGLKENVIIGKLIPARAPIDLPPPPVREIPLPEVLELEDGDDLFDDDDDAIRGLLGTLPLDEPEDDGEIIDDDDEPALADDVVEPSPEDLLDEDSAGDIAEVTEVPPPPAPSASSAYVAEPDEE